MRTARRARRMLTLQPAMTPMIDMIFSLLICFLVAPAIMAGEAYLAASTPVLVNPDGAVRHKSVVKAFDTAVAARYDTVCFGVPGAR